MHSAVRALSAPTHTYSIILICTPTHTHIQHCFIVYILTSTVYMHKPIFIHYQLQHCLSVLLTRTTAHTHTSNEIDRKLRSRESWPIQIFRIEDVYCGKEISSSLCRCWHCFWQEEITSDDRFEHGVWEEGGKMQHLERCSLWLIILNYRETIRTIRREGFEAWRWRRKRKNKTDILNLYQMMSVPDYYSLQGRSWLDRTRNWVLRPHRGNLRSARKTRRNIYFR